MLEATTFITGYAYLAGAYQHLGLFDDGNRWARRSVELGVARSIPVAEANGYEFLGENATLTGSWEEGLGYAAKEREIAARIHSRERQAWTHLVVSVCHVHLGDPVEAEREFREGIELAEALGEVRLVALLHTFYAILLADLGRTDEALEMARKNLERQEHAGMLHMHIEALRALAHVHFRRGELDEALARCEEHARMTAGKEARVSRLWLGPLHVEILLTMGRPDEARTVLATYADMVATCQTPYFTREVARLKDGIETR